MTHTWQKFQFSDVKDGDIRPESLQTAAPNAGGVGQNRRFSTNISLYHRNGAGSFS